MMEFLSHTAHAFIYEGCVVISIATLCWMLKKPLGWKRTERIIVAFACINFVIAACMAAIYGINDYSRTWAAALITTLFIALAFAWIAHMHDSTDNVRSITHERQEEKRRKQLYV